MPIAASKKNFGEQREQRDEAAVTKELFSRTRAELEADLEKIMEEVGADACDNTPRCVEAKLEIELYKAECDNAGAFKFKRFAREVTEAFIHRNVGKEIGSLPSELEKTRYLFVNMGELDRLNKQGHSQAGDAGLEAVVAAAKEVCNRELGAEVASKTEIFRYDRNDFVIKFDDATDEQLNVIGGALVNFELKLKNFGSIEAPPLSVFATDLNKVMDILTIVEPPSAENASTDQTYLANKVVEVMRREVDYNLEVEKFIRRIDRAVEKIEAVKAGTLPRQDADAFFNEYLKKGFHGSGLESFKDIEDLWKGGADPSDFNRAVELLAVVSSRARFAADRKFQLYENHLVSMRFLELSKHMGRRPEAEWAAEKLDDRQKIADIPRLTEGLAALERAEERMDAARATEWEKAEYLAYRIEAAKRDPGTGFFERGKFYEDWIVQVGKKGAEDATIVFIDMGFLKYFNDAGGRQVGDAALRKAAELMEKAIENAGVDGSAYRYGGDEFAIRLSGGRAAGKKLVVELNKLRKDAGRIPDLEQLRQATGDREIVGRSRFDYAPTELVFNSGIAEAGDVIEILSDLREAGELDEILETRNMSLAEFKAELLVKLADTSVNHEKASSRFRILIDMLNNPAYRAKDSAYHARTESIINYSQKAIFANSAGNDALRLFADIAAHETPAVADKLIDEFVADRIEKFTELVQGEKELTDKLIEVHAVRNRLLGQIHELESELAKKDKALASEVRLVKELQVRLQGAEEARRDIIAVRQKVGESGL